ncbi:MAG: NADPH-dependent FMN reductase [Cyanobacteria bacterium P01_G01_bin.54]
MENFFIPVILGTVRQGRLSEPVARFILEQVQAQSGVDTELIDIRALPLPMDDAGPTAKIPELSETMQRADGYIIVVPEYNHTYPGLLKHMLDLNYKEYLHKSVGLCTVSVGPFGGIRAGEALLPTLKAFGLGTIVADLNFGTVKTLVDEASGQLTEDAQTTYKRRLGRFMAELLWLTQTLKYGRENFAQEG